MYAASSVLSRRDSRAVPGTDLPALGLQASSLLFTHGVEGYRGGPRGVGGLHGLVERPGSAPCASVTPAPLRKRGAHGIPCAPQRSYPSRSRITGRTRRPCRRTPPGAPRIRI